MSPINSALQYKIQKMERHLSSLVEENAKLKHIIAEANYAGMSPASAFSAGGGAALGQQLAAAPQLGVGGVGKFTAGGNGLATSAGSGLNAGGVNAGGVNAGGANSVGLRSAQQGAGAGQFNGANLGALLAGLSGVPNADQILANYLGVPVAQAGALLGRASSATQTSQIRR